MNTHNNTNDVIVATHTSDFMLKRDKEIFERLSELQNTKQPVVHEHHWNIYNNHHCSHQ